MRIIRTKNQVPIRRIAKVVVIAILKATPFPRIPLFLFSSFAASPPYLAEFA
jgi:hypothetical protein